MSKNQISQENLPLSLFKDQQFCAVINLGQTPDTSISIKLRCDEKKKKPVFMLSRSAFTFSFFSFLHHVAIKRANETIENKSFLLHFGGGNAQPAKMHKQNPGRENVGQVHKTHTQRDSIGGFHRHELCC